MHIPLLNDILILFGIGIGVILLCHRLRIPEIVGMLLTGVVAGPHGLGLIRAVHEVETLSEIGIVVLLFTIGLELSFEHLLRMHRAVFWGGLLQVLTTALAGFAVSCWLGLPRPEAVLIGLLLSLSSTTIVLRLLQARAEIDSPHGQMSLAICIFQDLMIVPMMLLVPLLAGATAGSKSSPLFTFAAGIVVVLLTLIFGRWFIPALLYQVARTRSRELFLLSVLTVCLAVAGLTSSVGLSLALGAFLAGLIISTSEYTHQALGDLSSFRDVFMSFFFISVGMLLNVTFVIDHILPVLGITVGVIVLKVILAGLAAFLLGYPLRTTILAGLALAQIGEFSFILARAGLDARVLAADRYQYVLAVTVVTMAAAPFLIQFGPAFANTVLRLPFARAHKIIPAPPQVWINDHLIIIGFGINGRNLARAARAAGIRYVILEMNPETVRREKSLGEPIHYGDATQRVVLEHLGVKTARVVVIAISDPFATRTITGVVRDLSSSVYIIARTPFLEELRPLYELGANEVVPEEFETSIEIFTRVLKKYLVPQDDIEKFIAEVRSDSYEMLRTLPALSASLSDLNVHLPSVEIVTLRVGPDSRVANKTLAEVDLRKHFGVTVLVIQRNSGIIANPAGDTRVSPGDVLILLGTPENIPPVRNLFQPGR